MSWRPPLMIPSASLRLETGQLEEPALFGEPLHRSLVHRADATFEQIALWVVRLARHAVPALVQPLVHVAVVVDRLHEPLEAQVVTVLGRTDEVIVRDIEGGP